jgi:16S rRNA (guanine527-N7)-methyltransferase
VTISELDRLAHGAAGLGVPLGDVAGKQLVALLDLLAKWNAVYNLTALQTRDEWLALHLLDSLSVAPHILGTRCIDVGSGPGFPGLPLAIASPQQHWTLVDSNQKKSAFAAQAAAELGLKNVAVQQARIEAFRPHEKFDAVVSRAFSSLGDFVRLAGHLVHDDGYLMAMKGKLPTDELDGLPPDFRCDHIVALRVPGVDAERHLLLLQPVRNQR